MDKSKPSALLAAEKEDIVWKATPEKVIANPNKSFSTPELAPINKKTTLRLRSGQALIDKLPDWLNYIREQNLLAKWEEDLIGNERTLRLRSGQGLEPYWNESCQEISAQLLSVLKTDWCASDLTTSNGYVNNTAVKSWFSMRQYSLPNENSLKIYYPLSTVLAADYTDLESTKLCSKKIRIYPQPELEKIWKQWMAAARRCYNIAIALQRQSSKRISVFELEKLVVNDDSLPSWIKEVPRAIKVNAVKDAHAAYLKSKDAKFRSCRDQQQTIKFKNENYSKGTWYPRLTKGLTFKSVLPVPTNCDYGTQITKVKDRWYGIFPEVRFVLAKV
jgi:hypothetical protein